MTVQTPTGQPVEIELKLALPTTDPAGLAPRLAALPVLARHAATREQLHNIYYDTPAQRLRRERIALRLRRVDGDTGEPQWRQTLKIGGDTDSALSQRGEWESAVPGAALAWLPLAATPWIALDPDGALFQTLTPCFETRFERTRWRVERRDGSAVEVALDIGELIAGAARAPICELELELLAGPPQALFAVAHRLTHAVATLPLAASKAERGYALAEGRLDPPRHAAPPPLAARLAPPDAAARVLREALAQFTANLHGLYRADDPELAHQARVGWRRLRSHWRLFRPLLDRAAAPSWQALRPLLDALGALRDLDVARTETLPRLADSYVDDDARRDQWQALVQALTQAADAQRRALRAALETPAVGAALLAGTEWLLAPPAAQLDAAPVPLRPWARRRLLRLHRRLREALRATDEPTNQHRARILAKRLRYGIEALAPLLPQRAHDWQRRATQLQSELGAARDLDQALALARPLAKAPELAAFLHGMAVGRASTRPPPAVSR